MIFIIHLVWFTNFLKCLYQHQHSTCLYQYQHSRFILHYGPQLHPFRRQPSLSNDPPDLSAHPPNYSPHHSSNSIKLRIRRCFLALYLLFLFWLQLLVPDVVEVLLIQPQARQFVLGDLRLSVLMFFVSLLSVLHVIIGGGVYGGVDDVCVLLLCHGLHLLHHAVDLPIFFVNLLSLSDDLLHHGFYHNNLDHPHNSSHHTLQHVGSHLHHHIQKPLPLILSCLPLHYLLGYLHQCLINYCHDNHYFLRVLLSQHHYDDSSEAHSDHNIYHNRHDDYNDHDNDDPD